MNQCLLIRCISARSQLAQKFLVWKIQFTGVRKDQSLDQQFLTSIWTIYLPSCILVRWKHTWTTPNSICRSQSGDVNTIVKQINEDLSLIASWRCHNHLLINPDKTKLLVMGTRQMLKKTFRLPHYISGKGNCSKCFRSGSWRANRCKS